LTQGERAVAIGFEAGNSGQAVLGPVAIGYRAGNSNQEQGAVAVGREAGESNQGQKSVALGAKAGKNNQGDYSIAIGVDAATNGQQNNSLVINAGSGGVFGAGSLPSFSSHADGEVVINTGKGSIGYNGSTSWVIAGHPTNGVSAPVTMDAVIVSHAYTVATLPTGVVGHIARVTDASSPTIGSTVSGGGAAYALINYNGSNWTVIGV
jgi:hypothetical protein